MNRFCKLGLIVGFFSFIVVYANNKTDLSFTNDKFSEFLKRVVADKDVELFSSYYIALNDDVGRDKARAKSTHIFLFEKALVSLEKEHNNWLESIKTFLSADKPEEVELKKVQVFLRRYGAYQEYLAIRDVEFKKSDMPIGFFAKIGDAFSSIGQMVVGWFGFGATKTT